MLHHFDPFADYDWLARPGSRHRPFMAADIYREGDRYFVEIDVPGVVEENLDVTVEKKTLTVTVDRPYQKSEERTSIARGRPFGTYTRRFFLGERLDAESIEATLENGVLTLTIPIIETAKARKIEVGTIRTAIES